MRKIAMVLGAFVLASGTAVAADSERTLTGAGIGAGAGAIVAGPVGAVAGGAIGAAVGGPKLPTKGEVRRTFHRHKIYWKDRYGHTHWRWSA